MRLIQLLTPAEHRLNVRWAERLLFSGLGVAFIAAVPFFLAGALGRVIASVLFTIAAVLIAGCFGLRVFPIRAHRRRVAIVGWLSLVGAVSTLVLAVAIPASQFSVAVKRPATLIADLVAFLMVSVLFLSRRPGPGKGR